MFGGFDVGFWVCGGDLMGFGLFGECGLSVGLVGVIWVWVGGLVLSSGLFCLVLGWIEGWCWWVWGVGLIWLVSWYSRLMRVCILWVSGLRVSGLVVVGCGVISCVFTFCGVGMI